MAFRTSEPYAIESRILQGNGKHYLMIFASTFTRQMPSTGNTTSHTSCSLPEVGIIESGLPLRLYPSNMKIFRPAMGPKYCSSGKFTCDNKPIATRICNFQNTPPFFGMDDGTKVKCGATWAFANCVRRSA
jgi:hypothetical protein